MTRGSDDEEEEILSTRAMSIVLRLARVGTSVDSKASWARDEVVSEESNTKGYAA